MEWTLPYIISQFFIVINYILLIATYQLNSRKAILIFNFGALLATGLSFVFLSAYSGLAMVGVAIIRNIIFLYDENKHGKREQNTKKDFAILTILFAISIVSAIFTYNGFLSLMSVFATMLYTYSVWQKKTNVYKMLGIPVGMIWIVYDIYIMSLFAIILEAILTASAIFGYLREKRKLNERDEV